MTTAGQKIIDGLKDAVAGNFSRVHIPDGTGTLQTWARVDGGSDRIDIPRPQYEALMAAAKASAALEADVRKSAWPPDWFKSMAVMADALAALRSAGIDTEAALSGKDSPNE